MSKGREKKGPGVEVYENPDVLAEKFTKTEEFVKSNQKLVFIIGGVIALIVAGFVIFKFYITSQDKIAQTEMFQAVFYFEADSLEKALNGDGNNYGFLDIMDEYPMTSSANLSAFYAGASYLKLGQYEEAITYLEDFNASDLLLQARAYSLIGDAYMELGNFSNAADFYVKAADYKSNETFTPIYLMKAALAYEKLNDFSAAIATYDRIIDNYEGANEYQQARKHKVRLEALSTK